MFIRVSPVFTLKNQTSVYAFTTSTKRPILYIYYDDTLYEMSLLTHEMTYMRTFPSFDSVAMACDENDDLYVHGSNGCGSTYEGSLYRLASLTKSTRSNGTHESTLISNDKWDTESTAIFISTSEPRDPWEHLRESDLKEWRSPIYSQYWTRGRNNIWINNRRPNIIHLVNSVSREEPEDDVYYFHNASGFGKDLSGPFTCEDTCISIMWMAPYVDSHGNPEGIFLSGGWNYSKLFVTKGNTISLMWKSGLDVFEDLTYSLVTGKVYRLTIPPNLWKRKVEVHEAYISVFHYDVPSLFYLCSQVIRKCPDLVGQIPPCIREKMDISSTT